MCGAVAAQSGRERGVVRSRGYAWLRQKVRRSRDMSVAVWVQFAKLDPKLDPYHGDAAEVRALLEAGAHRGSR